jgi:hypothetical protein
MEIIVPFSIRRRELGGAVGEEPRKIFAKLKESPQLAVPVSARGLPERTTLHKVYATTPGGARRLLFFCRHAPRPRAPETKSVGAPPERWVLLFYRTKGDVVGENMSPKNPTFEAQLGRNLLEAIRDLRADSPAQPRCEKY